MLNNDQKTNKRVKSAWEVFSVSVSSMYMLNESQMFDCEEAAKKKKKKRSTGSKHPHRNLNTDLQVTKQPHPSGC